MNKDQKTLQHFISTAPEFQYSINLEYDLENVNKIQRYIAMENSLEVLSDIILSLKDHSSDRARLLVGSYGKGKSHLVLVLLGLLYLKDQSIFQNLLPKLKAYNTEAYDVIMQHTGQKKRFLPVVITGTDLDLKQSLLKGLKDVLKKENLDHLIPETYYDAAISMIKNWEENYPSTYERFEAKNEEATGEFIEKLKDYDLKTYEKFLRLYPELTSGGEFNPSNGIDVVKMYDNISKEIEKLGYKGIYIVYDEFSKYLEGSIDRNSAMEIKLLQDLAEKCNRSGSRQIHILLISHKYISNYVDMLPKEKIDAWKAVENRYKVVEMVNHKNQTYELMAEVIQKEENEWQRFLENHQQSFDFVALETSLNRVFGELSSDLEETIIYGGYPLHPVTTYLLPRISERIAQNERTIFTFLSTNEPNTLGQFILKEESNFPLMTPEYIFDYFENLFKQENEGSLIYETWRKTKGALKSLEEENQLKEAILKTMGLMHIIHEFQSLPPTEQVLNYIFKSHYSEVDIQASIQELIHEKIIISLKSKGYLDFAKVTKRNVQQEILEVMEKRKNLFDFKAVINEFTADQIVYPNRYNDKYEMVRYFDYDFITKEEFLETENWNSKIDSKERDGVIYAVILEDEDLTSYMVTEKIKKTQLDRAIFVLPNKAMNITVFLREYEAIQFLIGKNQHEDQDELYHEELTLYLDDAEHHINKELEIYMEPKLNGAKYFYNGKEAIIKRRSVLNHLVSDVCEKVYHRTPIIVNEVINKNEITAQAINGRKKVIEGILKNELTPGLGISGYGVDYSIKRSTLNNKRILHEGEDYAELHINDLGNDLQPVMNMIRDFFLNTSGDQSKSFEDLYDQLISWEHNIGMRRGLIPIYIAVVMAKYKQHLVITSNDQETPITHELLERISKTPGNYYASLENWDLGKEQYIDSLEKSFKEFQHEGEKEYNTFQYVAKSIQRWFLSLPKYTKESDSVYLGKGEFSKLNKEVLRFKNALKGYNINARDFLFNKAPRIYGFNNIDLKVFEYVQDTKNILDRLDAQLIESITKDLIDLFGVEDNEQATLPSVMRDWYDSLKEETKNNLFNQGEDRLLREVELITNDSREFIEKLGKALTGLRVEDWNEEIIIKFLERAKDYKTCIEAFNKELEYNPSRTQETYEVTFYENGKPVKKSFEKQEISNKAMLLYNEIESAMGDYGSSIKPNEKRQILLEIFKNFC